MPKFAVLFISATAVFLLSTVPRANATSFNCAKASSPIEHRICDDFELGILDGQLAAAYAGALDRSTHADQLVASQRTWLRTRDDCPGRACLVAAYEQRIARLAEMSDEPAVCTGATTVELNECAAEHSRRADKELDRYLAAARKHIAEDTAEARGEASTKDAPARFEAAQTAWAAYRKSECGAVYDSWSGGTIRNMMYESCWLTLTKSRSNVIWDLWLHFMDSTPPILPKPSEK